jgi:cation transport regulator ChaC
MSGVWVFGYGSLVSPESFGLTLGRQLEWGIDVFVAELRGYGRRWNYGVMHTVGIGVDETGAATQHTLVALGLVPSEDESVNGVIGWVSDAELVALDHRERHYDRVDVSRLVAAEGAPDALLGRAPVMVYVPRAEAIARYEHERDRGTAAIERRYWDLVDAAFAALGDEQHRRYHDTTPAPEVPVLELERS